MLHYSDNQDGKGANNIDQYLNKVQWREHHQSLKYGLSMVQTAQELTTSFSASKGKEKQKNYIAKD